MVLSRLKVVKDLLLAKLDTILSRLEAIGGTVETINTKANQTNAIAKASTADSASLLQACIHVIEQQQQVKQQNAENYQLLGVQLQLNQELNKANFADLNNTLVKLSEQVESIRQEQDKFDKQQRVIVKTKKSDFFNPEIGLMTYLYSYLPSRVALDIGANVGEVSESLLKCGYKVYAFEPYAPVFDKLKTKLSHYPEFHAFNLAIGSVDKAMPLYLASDLSGTEKHTNPSLFNSLMPHAMLEDLKFVDSVQVQVRNLASLHQASEISEQIGLVKIDTEGFDIEVIHGMGEYTYPVVITEFWDANHAFGKSPNLQNRIEDLVPVMKKRGYHWYIVIHRTGLCNAAFYCNFPQSVEQSWGNVFFFQSYEIFSQALKWCSAVLPETYFES